MSEKGGHGPIPSSTKWCHLDSLFDAAARVTSCGNFQRLYMAQAKLTVSMSIIFCIKFD